MKVNAVPKWQNRETFDDIVQAEEFCADLPRDQVHQISLVAGGKFQVSWRPMTQDEIRDAKRRGLCVDPRIAKRAKPDWVGEYLGAVEETFSRTARRK